MQTSGIHAKARTGLPDIEEKFAQQVLPRLRLPEWVAGTKDVRVLVAQTFGVWSDQHCAVVRCGRHRDNCFIDFDGGRGHQMHLIW